MRAQLRVVIGLLGLLLFVIGIAACGSDPTATPTSAPTATPVPDATATPTPSAMELFQIEWDELVAAAQAEGELVAVMSAGPVEQFGPVFEEWGRLFNIKPILQGGSQRDLADRIIVEYSQGLHLVDITLFGGGGQRRVIPAGLVAPLMEQVIVPDVIDRSGPEWRLNRWPWADSDAMFFSQFAVDASPNVAWLFYNTETVTPEELASLKSWFDLLRADFKLVIIDPSTGDSAQADRVGLWRLLPPEWHAELLRYPNLTILPVGTERQLADGMAQGEWDLAFFVGPALGAMRELEDVGLPVLEFPTTFIEGTTVSASRAMGIFVDPPHPNAAKLWINWIWSKEGGTVFNELQRRPGVAHLRADVPQGNVPDELWATLNRSIIEVSAEDPAYEVALAESLAWWDNEFIQLGLR